VMLATNASAAVADTRHADAFGNEMASWTSGAWTDSLAERSSWGHNTKELDGDTGLVYMYQRWYSGETGTFMSSAPRRVYREHRFSVARQHPVQRVDPFGTEDTTVGELIPEVICALAAGAAYALSWDDWKANDKLKHCIASCEIAKQCGALAAYIVGANKEGLDIFTGRGATEYDLNANNVGLDLACRGEDCVEGCHDALDAGQLPMEPRP